MEGYLRRQVRARLRAQIHASMLPNEMIRASSIFYCNFVAEGLVRLGAQAQLHGVDLLHGRGSEGNSILVRRCSALRAPG